MTASAPVPKQKNTSRINRVVDGVIRVAGVPMMPVVYALASTKDRIIDVVSPVAMPIVYAFASVKEFITRRDQISDMAMKKIIAASNSPEAVKARKDLKSKETALRQEFGASMEKIDEINGYKVPDEHGSVHSAKEQLTCDRN